MKIVKGVLNTFYPKNFGFSHHQLNGHHHTFKDTFLTIFKLMFRTKIFNNRLHFLVKAMRHIWKKMMFYLIIKKTMPKVNKVTPRIIIHATHNLSKIELTLTLMRRGELIDIAGRVIWNNN